MGDVTANGAVIDARLDGDLIGNADHASEVADFTAGGVLSKCQFPSPETVTQPFSTPTSKASCGTVLDHEKRSTAAAAMASSPFLMSDVIV